MVKRSISILFSFVMLAPAVMAEDATEKGMAAYRDHNYGVALTTLQQAVAASPSDENARYYLALTCQALSRTAEAQKQFRWVYDHAKNPATRAHAYQGLLSAQSKTTTVSTSRILQPMKTARSGSDSGSLPAGWLPAGSKIYEAKKDNNGPMKMNSGFVSGCFKH